MEEGVGPGVVAEAEELSQKQGEGELGLQALVGAALYVFWLISGGLQQKSVIVWFQHALILPFSVRSTGVELVARGMIFKGLDGSRAEDISFIGHEMEEDLLNMCKTIKNGKISSTRPLTTDVMIQSQST
ncbi:unnamed protein product [Leuciscus chuanchicus]